MVGSSCATDEAQWRTLWAARGCQSRMSVAHVKIACANVDRASWPRTSIDSVRIKSTYRHWNCLSNEPYLGALAFPQPECEPIKLGKAGFWGVNFECYVVTVARTSGIAVSGTFSSNTCSSRTHLAHPPPVQNFCPQKWLWTFFTPFFGVFTFFSGYSVCLLLNIDL